MERNELLSKLRRKDGLRHGKLPTGGGDTVKKEKEMDNLTRDVLAAEAAGLYQTITDSETFRVTEDSAATTEIT